VSPPYRYKITLAYDGTEFEGWQAQATAPTPHRPNVARTVQSTLEDALSRLSRGAPVRVVGAGRTDAGVHALGQVASFDLERPIPPEALQRALNGLLPRDARVLRCEGAAPDFDARRDAVSKLYRYVMDLGPVRVPTRRLLTGHHFGSLDPERVAEAAALFVGRRDFAALASAGGGVQTTVRTVLRSEAHLAPLPDVGDPYVCLVYEVVASGFLRKMVRSMVGGIVAAGAGRRTIASLEQALLACDRGLWPPPAEACGLTLVSISYP
jgi:tRNA pseudouridine38-40 synthase